MGSLKELGDFFRDSKGTIKELTCKVNDLKGQSIAKKSAASTLQFPVIMSRSINVDTASTVVKALERQYAIFVQLTIQLHPVIDWREDDIGSFISKIHQNNPTPIELIESCINVYSDETIGMRMIMSLNEGCNAQVIKANKDQMLVIEDCLNQTKLNDIYKPNQITLEQANASLDYYMLSEAKERPKKWNGKKSYKGMDGFAQAYNDLQKGKNPEPSHAGVNVNPTQGAGGVKEDHKTQQPVENGATAKGGKTTAGNTGKAKDNISGFNNGSNRQEIDGRLRGESDKREREAEKARFKLEIDKANAEARARAVVKLADNDVKKCNELVPTTLSVTIQQYKGDAIGGNVTFVLGIKGLMHPVGSEEMVSNLLDGYKDGNKFFNFLRWTSGEISFLKDLVLNIDGIKEDAIKKHSKGSHWWTTLKKRKTLSRVKNLYGKNKILPNATIVCSMEEVMEIKDTYNVDLMDPKHVRRIMDRYFLLGFVIVDESQEMCQFIFDGENNFATLSFSGLERENNNKNDFKDIYKMINSGRL